MRYKTAFRLALQLVGVLLIGFHLPWWIGAAVSLFEELFSSNLGFRSIAAFAIPQLVGNGVGVALGAYLFFGGRWIVNRAIPSNRPYCHECGYELTGLPAGANCPECGTPTPPAPPHA